jgi:Fe-S cluster assembly iron-binding protein IscA
MSSEEHRKAFLSISEAALDEIRARLKASDFPPDIGVRISPGRLCNSDVVVAFDYPVSDGRDWIDEADGIAVLIDKDDEPRLCGRTIEYNGKVFTAAL